MQPPGIFESSLYAFSHRMSQPLLAAAAAIAAALVECNIEACQEYKRMSSERFGVRLYLMRKDVY